VLPTFTSPCPGFRLATNSRCQQGTRFFFLLGLCRDSRSSSVQFALIEADAAMHAATGISAVASAPLRALLLLIAHRTWELHPHRPCPGHEDLIKQLALAGPPDNFEASVAVRDYIAACAGGGPFLRRDVEAALIRGRWRDPSVRGLLSLGHCPQRQAEPDEAGAVELLDALGHVGFLTSRDDRAQVLRAVACRGTPELMAEALRRIPLDSVSKRQLSLVLPAAAEGGAGRAAMLTLLLDSGLDPNMVNFRRPSSAGPRNALALHNAVQCGDGEMVEVLLQRGAKMVPDVDGVTPLQMAERRSQLAGMPIVMALRAWLDERGLPWDHVDEPTVVEEREEYVLAAAERGEGEDKGVLEEAKREEAAQVGGGKGRSIFSHWRRSWCA
jgi:hypothetical protein